MTVARLIISIAGVIVLGGCAVGNDAVRDLSTERLAHTIVDHRTTNADVVSALGEPDYVQRTSDGERILHYSWTRGRPSAKNFIPFNPVAEYPMTQKTLRVWVDNDGIVRRHDFSGIFYIRRMPLIGADDTHSIRPLTEAELNALADS